MSATRTIALVSQKGGAGKSTLALHLAAEAAARGQRALLVDLDPQGNVAKWGDRRGQVPPDVSAEHPANLDKALLAAAAEGYAVIVLDTAPHADQTALRAARSADLVLVPCRPATFDLEAINTTLDLCQLTKRPAMVVLNAAPIRSRVVDEAQRAVGEHGGEVCPVVIHHRVAFQHCLIDGRTAAEFEPEGAAALEIAALYADVLSRLNADAPSRRSADVSA
jgi:chromosome partitioning protein